MSGLALVMRLRARRMKFLGSVFSRKAQEEFGLGQRFPLTKDMNKGIKRHMNGLSQTDLSSYTFERRRSDYQHAKADLVIYDGHGTAVLNGRELDGGNTSYWSMS